MNLHGVTSEETASKIAALAAKEDEHGIKAEFVSLGIGEDLAEYRAWFAVNIARSVVWVPPRMRKCAKCGVEFEALYREVCAEFHGFCTNKSCEERGWWRPTQCAIHGDPLAHPASRKLSPSTGSTTTQNKDEVTK